MVTVLLRTIIIYLLLIIAMRLMGKRQVGELEVSDLVTTFLLSEIASLPITDSDLPLSHSIVPIVTLLALEVIISVLLTKFPKFKSLFAAHPATLVKDGNINQKAMNEARISSDELFCELRRQGVDDISQIKYAILEQNGTITVIQKAKYRQPYAEQLNLKPKETGIFHIVVEQGVVSKHGLDCLGISKQWLKKELAKRQLKLSDIYLMMMNDAWDIQIVKKEEKGNKK